MDWQPIETAPKEQYLILYDYSEYPSVLVGEWDQNDDVWRDHAVRLRVTPSHWMPLPQPPTK